MTRTLHCIINPHAGGGRTGERWPQIARGLAAAGFEVVAKMTGGPGDATYYTRAMANDMVIAGQPRTLGVRMGMEF